MARNTFTVPEAPAPQGEVGVNIRASHWLNVGDAISSLICTHVPVLIQDTGYTDDDDFLRTTDVRRYRIPPLRRQNFGEASGTKKLGMLVFDMTRTSGYPTTDWTVNVNINTVSIGTYQLATGESYPFDGLWAVEVSGTPTFFELEDDDANPIDIILTGASSGTPDTGFIRGVYFFQRVDLAPEALAQLYGPTSAEWWYPDSVEVPDFGACPVHVARNWRAILEWLYEQASVHHTDSKTRLDVNGVIARLRIDELSGVQQVHCYVYARCEGGVKVETWSITFAGAIFTSTSNSYAWRSLTANLTTNRAQTLTLSASNCDIQSICIFSYPAVLPTSA